MPEPKFRHWKRMALSAFYLHPLDHDGRHHTDDHTGNHAVQTCSKAFLFFCVSHQYPSLLCNTVCVSDICFFSLSLFCKGGCNSVLLFANHIIEQDWNELQKNKNCRNNRINSNRTRRRRSCRISSLPPFRSSSQALPCRRFRYNKIQRKRY